MRFEFVEASLAMATTCYDLRLFHCVCGRAARVFNLEISSLHAVHTHKHGAERAIFHCTV